MAWNFVPCSSMTTSFSTISILNSMIFGACLVACSCGCTKGGATSSTFWRGSLRSGVAPARVPQASGLRRPRPSLRFCGLNMVFPFHRCLGTAPLCANGRELLCAATNYRAVRPQGFYGCRRSGERKARRRLRRQQRRHRSARSTVVSNVEAPVLIDAISLVDDVMRRGPATHSGVSRLPDGLRRLPDRGLPLVEEACREHGIDR